MLAALRHVPVELVDRTSQAFAISRVCEMKQAGCPAASFRRR